MRERPWRWPWSSRAELAADVRDELDTHLALQIDDLVAEGMTREAAGEEARRRFGDRRVVEKELTTLGRRRLSRARRLELLTDLAEDVRLALRQLRRQRAFALAVIAVIGLGVGASTAVYAVVDAGLLRPLPFGDGDALVYLWDAQDDGQEQISPSLPEYRDWAREGTFLEASVALTGSAVRLRGERGWEIIEAGRIEGDMRAVTARAPLLGRWFTPDEIRAGARLAVLDEVAWRQRFGGRADVLGETLSLADGAYTVVGVAPSETHLLRGAGELGAVALWLPLVEEPWMERGLHFLRVVGRLRDGIDADAGRAAAGVLERQLQASEITRHGIVLTGAREVLVGQARPIFLALAGAALFVLLTVCANLGNLLVWKSLARGRELAVRAALGASRARLVRMVLTESLVIGVLGGIAGLAVAHVLLGVTRAVAGRAGSLAPAHPDLRVILFGIALSALVGLVFGLWPALRASRADVSDTLKEGAGSLAGGGRPWRRKALVGAEVAFSVVLLCGTGLLLRSLTRMLDEDPGFRADKVVAFRLSLGDERYDDDARVAAFLHELRARLTALSGVAAAGVSSQLPLERSDTSGSFEIAGRVYDDDNRPSAKKRIVGPGYFEALRIPLRRGRAFTEADRAGAPDVVIISETIARQHFPGEDPVGERLRFSWGPGEEQEIVGVVADVRHDGLDRPSQGMLYRPAGQGPRRGLSFVVRTTGAGGWDRAAPPTSRTSSAVQPSRLMVAPPTAVTSPHRASGPTP